MSNHICVRCVQCNEEGGVYLNHRTDYVVDLIRLADALCLYAETVMKLKIMGCNTSLTINFEQVDTEFFLAHRGHTLVAASEYGYDVDQCSKYLKCTACPRPRGKHCPEHETACTLDNKHDGPCQTDKGSPRYRGEKS